MFTESDVGRGLKTRDNFPEHGKQERFRVERNDVHVTISPEPVAYGRAPDERPLPLADSVISEIRELIEDESHVDLVKLAEIARGGLPAALRGDVWRYLLGVAKADKSEELTHEKELAAAYQRLRRSALAALGQIGQGLTETLHGAEVSERGGFLSAGGAAASAPLPALPRSQTVSEDTGRDYLSVQASSPRAGRAVGHSDLETDCNAFGRGSLEYTGMQGPEPALLNDAGEMHVALTLEQSTNWDGTLARRIRNDAKRRIERERLRIEHSRWRRSRLTMSSQHGRMFPSQKRAPDVQVVDKPREQQDRSLRNVGSETNLVNPRLVRAAGPYHGLSDGDESVKAPSRPPSAPTQSGVMEYTLPQQLDHDEAVLCSSPESTSSATNSMRSAEAATLQTIGEGSVLEARDGMEVPAGTEVLVENDVTCSGSRLERASGDSITTGISTTRGLASAMRTPHAALVRCYVSVLCTYLYVVELSVRHMVALPLIMPLDTKHGSTTELEKVNDVLMSLGTPVEYAPTMVSLVHVFVQVFTSAREMDVYYGFCALMHRFGHVLLFTTHGDGLTRATAHFLMLFRTLLPDLADFFESEEIEHQRWLHGWLQGLFSRGEMPVESTLRIWDFYLSSGLEMHPYVCLAVLDLLQEEITELDGPEVVTYLGKLPDNLDPEKLLTRAVTIRETALGSGLVPPRLSEEQPADSNRSFGIASLRYRDD
jgi:hypothetical protein